MVRISFAMISLVLLLLVAGCGSSDVSSSLTAEERFKHAKELFDKEDYLEAINEFTIITIQFQGSAFAADAQFYLGECRFSRGEFLLAAFEYSTLKRNYPASPRVPDAQYQLAFSYYRLAPRSALDQQYTRRAIDEFQSFVEYYPSNPRAVQADEKIRELTARLAKKTYETARLYSTMDYYKAAMYYYDEVIEKYHDTEYAPPAFLDKVELLMSKRKFQEAGKELDRFIGRYPNSVLRSRADSLKETVEKELKSKSQLSGMETTGHNDIPFLFGTSSLRGLSK